MSLKEDIYEQPRVFQRWLETHLADAQEIARVIRERDVDYVFLAARGTSDRAGVYAQYVWGSLNHLPVAFAAPSLFTAYAGWPRLRNALVVGVSQSGQSPDVVSVLTEGRRQGTLTLAITNAPGSPLAQAAEWHLDIGAGPETAVAATKTYTTELLALAGLSAALQATPEPLAALRRLPAAMEAALALAAPMEALASQQRAMSRCIVLGRGYHYASAQEWALKLKELTYVFADAYSTADFQHGPLALVEPGLPVLAVAPSGAVLPDLLALLRQLREQYQAELLILSDDAEALALTPAAAPLPAGVPEWLMPLVSIVPAQLFCYHLARAKGYDTEAPRHLHKVTLTR